MWNSQYGCLFAMYFDSMALRLVFSISESSPLRCPLMKRLASLLEFLKILHSMELYSLRVILLLLDS